MPKIKKICVVCGKPFEVYPSESGIQCCSRKCGAALRTMHGKRKLKGWNQKSKADFRDNPKAKAARATSIPKAFTAAMQLPEGQKGPQNREAMVWILVSPDGVLHKAVNLNDWARKNRSLFFDNSVSEDIAVRRISGGFRAIALWMSGAKSRTRPVTTYKGWRLMGLPTPKSEGDNDYDNRIQW